MANSGHSLIRSPRFLGNQRLLAAAQNNPPLTKGASGKAVRIVQRALIDLGYQMPVSTKKYGSPDGVFGDETFSCVWQFQHDASLAPDGKIGRDTMQELDVRLPNDSGPLPDLPSNQPYRVPGMLLHLRQPSDNTCWATCYAMLLTWRFQQSFDPRAAAIRLGQEYHDRFDTDQGLPVGMTLRFAGDARLTAEPCYSLPVDGWLDLLRRHGPLMIAYGWKSGGSDGAPTKYGLHDVVIYGMAGDGTPENTEFLVYDPGREFPRVIPFLKLMDGYELGYTYDGKITNAHRKGYSQIMHW